MYQWCEDQVMPLSPGILWTLDGQYYKKSVMKAGTSLGAVQWLDFMQQSDICIDSSGNRVTIQHAYYQGEKQIVDGETTWDIDGYFKRDGQEFFLEYNGKFFGIRYGLYFYKYRCSRILVINSGCWFHPGCCVPDSKIKDADKKRENWMKKSSLLESRGTLIVMWDCKWRKILQNLPKFPTRLGRILERDSQDTLLDAIKSETVFGFIKCDIATPIEHIEEFKAAGFLFPPVISKRKLTEAHLSPYMKQRYAADCKSPAETVIQSYFGENVLLMTSLAKLYMDRGMKISNVTRFVQYEPGRALAPFVEKVKQMRIAATIEKDDLKATTAKLVGNSCKF